MLENASGATLVIESGRTKDVNDCVPEKHFAPIVSTPEGIVIELSFIQRLNIFELKPFKFIPDSNITLSKLMHVLKQAIDNSVTRFGIVIVFKLVHEPNGACFIFVNEFGSAIVGNCIHKANAKS